jgi:transcriptional regulator NrdR family protein
MRCPTCKLKKTTIIRTRPDPDNESTDHVRQCRNPACLAIFNSRETVINVIDFSDDREIVTALASRISALPDGSREALLKLVMAQ